MASLRPTLFGVRLMVFHGLCVGAFFATPYVNLFFMLLGFLSLVLTAALFASWRSIKGVSVGSHGQFEALAMAGESPTVQLDLHAEGRRTHFGLQVDVDLEGPRDDLVQLRGTLAVVRPPNKTGLLLHSSVPLARGIWRSENAVVSTTYPFGVFRRRRAFAVALEVAVYPVPSVALTEAKAGAFHQLMSAQLGGSAVQASSGVQPTSLREHKPGESLRSVHWRASARRGKLVALEWEADDSEALEVVLDRRVSGEVFEEALSDLCAVALAAKEGADVLSLRTQGFDQAFGEGQGSFDTLLHFLAGVQSIGEAAEAPPPSSPGALRLPRQAVEEEADAA